MKKSDLIDYDNYRQIYLDDEPNASEEQIKKDYKDLLEGEEFEYVVRIIGVLNGTNPEKIEESIESIKKK